MVVKFRIFWQFLNYTELIILLSGQIHQGTLLNFEILCPLLILTECKFIRKRHRGQSAHSISTRCIEISDMVPVLGEIGIQRHVLHLLRSSWHSSELLNLVCRAFDEVLEFVGWSGVLSELLQHFSQLLVFLVLALQDLGQLVHRRISRVSRIHGLIGKACHGLHPWILLRIRIKLSLRRHKRVIALLWIALERIPHTNLRSTEIGLSGVLRVKVVVRKLLSVVILWLRRLLK